MKLKNVLIIAIAIVTLGLVVACSDDVVVASKDNNTNFAQVLESNGAFEYAGTKYETLQDAIEAIDKAKGDAPKTIKVLRDGVKTGAATVPSSINGDGIALDLNGNSLSFLSSTGVTVNGKFYVTGEGEIKLEDKSAEATAFAVGQGGTLTVENTVINTGDQYAVKAAGTGAKVTFGDKAAVAGNIAASDSATVTLANGSDVSGAKTVSSSATLNINSESVGDVTGPITLSGGNAAIRAGLALTDAAPIAMQGSSQLSVNTGAAAYISEFDSTCTIYCSVNDAASITAAEGVTIPSDRFVYGFCYVLNVNEEKVYFTSLADAATFAGDSGTVTYVRDHSETGASALTYNISKNVTVVMTGFAEDSKLTISSDKTLTLQGGTLNGTVDGPGALVSKNATFEAAIGGTTDLASITDGTVGTAGTGSTFKKAIKTSGLARFNYSVFSDFPAITSTLIYSSENAPLGVAIYNATGTTGGITANSGVIIDNHGLTTANDSLTTGAITASYTYNEVEYYCPVSVYGPTGTYSSTETGTLTIGSIAKAGDVSSQRAVFAGAVGSATYKVSSLTDGANGPQYSDGSTFNEAVTASGAITLYNSTTKANVTSDEKVIAYNATLGDNASEDSIYAPVIKVENSVVKIANIMKDSNNTAAKAVILTNLKGGTINTIKASAGTTADSVYTTSPKYAVYITNANTANLSIGAIEAAGRATSTDPSLSKVDALYIQQAVKSDSETTQFTTTVTGDIEATVVGTVVLDKVATQGNITASVSVNATNGCSIGDDASADNVYSPSITISGSTVNLNRIMESYVQDSDSTLAGDQPAYYPATSVSVTNSSGNIKWIKANQTANTSDAITLSSSSSAALAIGSSTETDNVVEATVGKVVINGNSASSKVTVAENVYIGNGALTSTYATFSNTVQVYNSTDTNATLTDGTDADTAHGSEFNGNVIAEGALQFYGSSFSDSPTITSTNGGSITIMKSTGTAGAITTENPSSVPELSTATSGTITINNSALDTDASLTTGNLSASYKYDTTVGEGTNYVTVYGDVEVKGQTKAKLSVGAVTGNDITVTNATVTGTVNAKTSSSDAGDVTSNGSEFRSTIYATGFVKDGTDSSTHSGSEFKGNISAAKSLEFYGSNFSTNSPTISSTGEGAITIMKSEGTTGTISNDNGGVTINNSSESEKRLATGSITAHGAVSLTGPSSVAYTPGTDTKVVLVSGNVNTNGSDFTATNVGISGTVGCSTATIQGGVIDGRVTLDDGTSGSTKSSSVSVYTIGSNSYKSKMKGGFFVGDYHTLTINDGVFGDIDSSSSTSAPIEFDTAYSSARIINGTFYVGTPDTTSTPDGEGDGSALYLENVIESFYYVSMSNEVNIYLTDNIVMDRQINTPAYKNVEFYGGTHSITNSSTATSYIRVDTGKFNLYNMTLTNNGTSNYNPIFAIYGGAYVYNITCTLVYDDAIKTMN